MICDSIVNPPTHTINRLGMHACIVADHCNLSIMSAIILLLSFLWSLVEEVHSQTEYPYVSFMGEILPNHTYVDLTTVGNNNSDPGNTVKCHTDLTSCCSGIVLISIVEINAYYVGLYPPSGGNQLLTYSWYVV